MEWEGVGQDDIKTGAIEFMIYKTAKRTENARLILYIYKSFRGIASTSAKI